MTRRSEWKGWRAYRLQRKERQVLRDILGKAVEIPSYSPSLLPLLLHCLLHHGRLPPPPLLRRSLPRLSAHQVMLVRTVVTLLSSPSPHPHRPPYLHPFPHLLLPCRAQHPPFPHRLLLRLHMHNRTVVTRLSFLSQLPPPLVQFQHSPFRPLAFLLMHGRTAETHKSSRRQLSPRPLIRRIMHERTVGTQKCFPRPLHLPAVQLPHFLTLHLVHQVTHAKTVETCKCSLRR